MTLWCDDFDVMGLQTFWCGLKQKLSNLLFLFLVLSNVNRQCPRPLPYFFLKPQSLHEVYYPFHGVFLSFCILWFIPKPVAAKPPTGRAQKSCSGINMCVSREFFYSQAEMNKVNKNLPKLFSMGSNCITLYLWAHCASCKEGMGREAVLVFDLKSILSATSIAPPTLFWLPFAWNVLF